MILKRLGLSRIGSVRAGRAGPLPRHNPGGLTHIDIKKLGRVECVGHHITGDCRQGNSHGAGWAGAHAGIDGVSWLASSQILADEKKDSAVAFLEAAVARYASLPLMRLNI